MNFSEKHNCYWFTPKRTGTRSVKEILLVLGFQIGDHSFYFNKNKQDSFFISNVRNPYSRLVSIFHLYSHHINNFSLKFDSWVYKSLQSSISKQIHNNINQNNILIKTFLNTYNKSIDITNINYSVFTNEQKLMHYQDVLFNYLKFKVYSTINNSTVNEVINETIEEFSNVADNVLKELAKFCSFDVTTIITTFSVSKYVYIFIFKQAIYNHTLYHQLQPLHKLLIKTKPLKLFHEALFYDVNPENVTLNNIYSNRHILNEFINLSDVLIKSIVDNLMNTIYLIFN